MTEPEPEAGGSANQQAVVEPNQLTNKVWKRRQKRKLFDIHFFSYIDFKLPFFFSLFNFHINFNQFFLFFFSEKWMVNYSYCWKENVVVVGWMNC